MKLYFSAGACSMIVRMVLIHVDAHFEAHPVDLARGEQRSPAFLAMNPKGKVPVLVRDDGSVLTELGTILAWIAATHPEYALLPQEFEAEIRVRETIEYCVSTMHALGTLRIFVPSAFGSDDRADEIREEGRGILSRGLLVVGERLDPSGYVSAQLSVADFVLFWLSLGAVMSGMSLPTAIERHYRSMQELGAVRRALADEGFASE